MFLRRYDWFILVGLLFFVSACNRQSSHGDEGLTQVVIAKVIIQPNNKTVSNLHKNSLEDFYDHQVSLLESSELAKIAEKKSKEQVPDGGMLHLQVARIKGSSVFNFIARSASANYGKVYLNTLINSYLERVQGTRDQSTQVKSTDVITQSKIEEAYQKVQLAERKQAMFKLENDSSGIEMEQSIAKRRLKKLETALNFYNSELDQMNKLGLENDIRRRSVAAISLPDMPEEFARMISSGLSPNEQAYLDSLSKTDERTKVVTEALAANDSKARTESYRHQADAVQELINDIKKRNSEIEVKLNESARLDSELIKMRSIYNELKTPTTNQAQSIKDQDVEGVIVSVIQEPILLDKEN